jgi:uncharacterized Fe-S cluster-containing radical SAM superfamily protein
LKTRQGAAESSCCGHCFLKSWFNSRNSVLCKLTCGFCFAWRSKMIAIFRGPSARIRRCHKAQTAINREFLRCCTDLSRIASSNPTKNRATDAPFRVTSHIQ